MKAGCIPVTIFLYYKFYTCKIHAYCIIYALAHGFHRFFVRKCRNGGNSLGIRFNQPGNGTNPDEGKRIFSNLPSRNMQSIRPITLHFQYALVFHQDQGMEATDLMAAVVF